MGEGDEIRVIRTRNEDSEAERVATEILAHRLKHDTSCTTMPSFIGVIPVPVAGDETAGHQIPYKLSGGTSFFPG